MAKLCECGKYTDVTLLTSDQSKLTSSYVTSNDYNFIRKHLPRTSVLLIMDHTFIYERYLDEIALYHFSHCI